MFQNIFRIDKIAKNQSKIIKCAKKNLEYNMDTLKMFQVSAIIFSINHKLKLNIIDVFNALTKMIFYAKNRCV